MEESSFCFTWSICSEVSAASFAPSASTNFPTPLCQNISEALEMKSPFSSLSLKKIWKTSSSASLPTENPKKNQHNWNGNRMIKASKPSQRFSKREKCNLDECLFLRQKRMQVLSSWTAASGYEEVERILKNASENSWLKSQLLKESPLDLLPLIDCFRRWRRIFYALTETQGESVNSRRISLGTKGVIRLWNALSNLRPAPTFRNFTHYKQNF